MWKKCGLEGVIENEMTDRLADKLQYKNQIYSDDDWILSFSIKPFFFVKRVKRRLKKLEHDLKTNFAFHQVSYKISIINYIDILKP